MHYRICQFSCEKDKKHGLAELLVVHHNEFANSTLGTNIRLYLSYDFTLAFHLRFWGNTQRFSLPSVKERRLGRLFICLYINTCLSREMSYDKGSNCIMTITQIQS